jgi:hypothetical protein
VGPGGSQEAPFDLLASVPAGTYHLECDAIIIGSVDVQFSLIWRHASGADDTTLAQWIQHWEPLPDSAYDAQAYDTDQAAPAIDYAAGDQLVFRYAALNTTTAEAFIPNGDGSNANGRIPAITLPP